MPHSDIVKLLLDHRINVLSGDSSQILQFALHVSSLPSTIRDSIRITKIFYTSEPLIRSQRAYLTSVFGPVLIFSVFASAESGPWAVMNLAVTRDIADDAADFIFDTRNIIVEVLPLSAGSGDAESGQEDKHQLPDGEVGVIALTSLQRLRNPLVRYVSGDLGSLHPLPANDRIPPDAAQHLKVGCITVADRSPERIELLHRPLRDSPPSRRLEQRPDSRYGARARAAQGFCRDSHQCMFVPRKVCRAAGLRAQCY
jgi:hypothetical protein